MLFHESEVLGAGVSVSRVLDELRLLGWSGRGWFPGPGPMLQETAAALASQGWHEKPLAFSAHGWMRAPGPAARLRATPSYLRAFESWLLQQAPDVVHANSLLMLPEAAIARRHGRPVVFHVHEIPAPGIKRSAAVRLAAALAEALVAVSEPVAAVLRPSTHTTPLFTVNNGVPPREPSRGGGDEFVVGTVGHISRTKGTDVFLEAAARVHAVRPDIRFEHVGPARLWGEDEFDDRVESLAAAPSLESVLRMHGPQPADAFLEGWSLFVLPSRQDAFPLSSLEAMAAGVPVLASAVGGIPEQIEHLQTGVLVPPDAPEAICEWIVRLHDAPELRRRLADRARARVRETFSLSRQARGLELAYLTAIERSQAHRQAALGRLEASTRSET